jgi:phosphoribosylamine--glycine ligase
MRILILGSGAREHAIVKALIRTGTDAQRIVCVPGNEGIAAEVECKPGIDPTDAIAVVRVALSEQIGLAVIGPEAPLVAGVGDALREQGIAVFGPSKEAAQLEGSKAFAKQIMAAAEVPTAQSRTCDSMAEVISAMDQFGAPWVIKADGLAAGKGVIVTSDRASALEHAGRFMPGRVLVEEFLDGDEVSLFFLSDGETVVPLSPAQDYKRAFDNDEGPNTGGMGAYSPLPWLPDEFAADVSSRIAEPVVAELARREMPFVGLLYCGLIVTNRGIRVIEFNARFGDPETQVVLARLASQFEPLLMASATGKLDSLPAPRFNNEVAVTVVLASEGYPTNTAEKRPIEGLAAAAAVEGVEVCRGSDVGRVLSVVATAVDFQTARTLAYEALSRIQLEGSHYRHDIALKVTS